MSDFESILNDALYDQYLIDRRYEKEMEIATLNQCIYLFVEGLTEEKTYPELLAKCDIDLVELGIIVANYNGIGNLIPSLRLLHKTLSSKRPVVITFDNDEEGIKHQNKIQNLGLNPELITLMPIPSIVKPIQYPSGHYGGSFEELFPSEHFIEQVFCRDFMPAVIVSEKAQFVREFQENKSWLKQAAKFCADRDDSGLSDLKIKIGVRLAETCRHIPPDIQKLASSLREVRGKYPIRHFSDIAEAIAEREIKEDNRES